VVYKTHDIKVAYENLEDFAMRSNQNTKNSFGQRIKAIREARGLTQEELARKIGGSQKMITHYENRVKFPPVTILPKLARALKVTTDELLGVKSLKDGDSSANKKLMRRFNYVGDLPLRDQRTVFALINALKAKQSSKKFNNG